MILSRLVTHIERSTRTIDSCLLSVTVAQTEFEPYQSELRELRIRPHSSFGARVLNVISFHRSTANEHNWEAIYPINLIRSTRFGVAYR